MEGVIILKIPQQGWWATPEGRRANLVVTPHPKGFLVLKNRWGPNRIIVSKDEFDTMLERCRDK